MRNDKNLTVYDIAVIGASGGIGRQVVELALNEGHKVMAILRTPSKLSIKHPDLTIIKGDVMNPESLKKDIGNKDVVISAIGKNSFKETKLYSEGSKNLIKVLDNTNTNRAFFISASGLEVNPSFSFIYKLLVKYVLQKLLKNMFLDLEKMEKIIKESDLNWTIMRPPSLTNKPVTGRYRFSINNYLENGRKISRIDLAHFMINNIKNESIYKKTVEVAY